MREFPIVRHGISLYLFTFSRFLSTIYTSQHISCRRTFECNVCIEFLIKSKSVFLSLIDHNFYVLCFKVLLKTWLNFQRWSLEMVKLMQSTKVCYFYTTVTSNIMVMASVDFLFRLGKLKWTTFHQQQFEWIFLKLSSPRRDSTSLHGISNNIW